MVSISWPSNLTITSLGSMPAAAAGLPGETLATSAPFGSCSPRLAATSSVTFCTCTPSQPRRVSPNCLSWSRTCTAVLAGTAKPMPIEPPVGEMIAVFTPITSPSMLNSGPPELPRLMAASVWRKSS